MSIRRILPVVGPLLVLVGANGVAAQSGLIPIAQSDDPRQNIQPANLELPPSNAPLPLGGRPLPRVGTGLVPLPPTGTTPPPWVGRPGLGNGPTIPLPSLVPPPQKSNTVESVPIGPALVATPMNPTPEPPKAVPMEIANSAPLLTSPASTRHATALIIDTVGPDSAGIGQQVRYEIRVRNAGESPVFQVRVEEELPKSTKYISSDPPGEVVGDRIVWMIGGLDSGAERKIRVDVRPTAEGELRTRATVTASATTGLRTMITRPKVTAGLTGPSSASVGDAVVFNIALTNTGSGQANRMLLRATLSDGLQHVQGTVIEAELAGIPPGETKSVTLRTIAAKSGPQHCELSVVCDGGAESTAKSTLNVVEPSLQIKQLGPTKCIVSGEPTFTVEVANPGSSSTQPVQVLTSVPEGLTFVNASDGGTYDEARRSIVWNFPGQTAGATKTLTFKARATSAGEWIIRSLAQAGPRLDSKSEIQLKIEGIPALYFEVVDLADPVPAGKETTYEIRVVNQGTCACTNVQLVAAMSEGLSVTSVTGAVGHKVAGQQITFETLPRLATKADAVVRVKVKGTAPGDLRFKVALSCTEIATPITKEESTRFYRAD